MQPEESIAEQAQPEVVDGVPVLAEVWPVKVEDRSEDVGAAPAPLTPPGTVPAALPAAQAAAAVATGFVAGAATIALVRRLGRRRPAQGPRRRSREGELVSIAGTRSFLIDVHVLRAGDE